MNTSNCNSRSNEILANEWNTISRNYGTKPIIFLMHDSSHKFNLGGVLEKEVLVANFRPWRVSGV
jgi:hypothetical protein